MNSLCARILASLIAPVAFAQQPSTADGKSPFLSVPTGPEKIVRFAAQLPEFEVRDITGRTWRLQSLLGKFTLVYIWGTGEARIADAQSPEFHKNIISGLPDLPELQRFNDKAQSSKNIQVLAFCTDYDYMRPHDYMKQTKYTFPVIADWSLTRKLFPRGGAAQRYWLVNPEGRLSYPLLAWNFKGLLYELERIAAQN